MDVQAAKPVARDAVLTEAFVWALASLCRLHRVPFDAELVLKQFPPPYDLPTLLRAAQACGLKAGLAGTQGDALERLPLPCLGFVRTVDSAPTTRRLRRRRCWCAPTASGCSISSPARKRRARWRAASSPSASRTWCCSPRRRSPRRTIRTARRSAPSASAGSFPSSRTHKRDLARRAARFARDPAGRPGDAALHAGHHRQGGGAPDAEHADRHRRRRSASSWSSTPAMTWVRQYLVLHTGNRVDAVLGSAGVRASAPPAAAVLRAPPDRQHWSRACTAWRRSASSSPARRSRCMLDLPFLLIFLAVMFFYSWQLSLIALGMLC